MSSFPVESLAKVLRYLRSVERGEIEGGHPDGHIFWEANRLSDWLENVCLEQTAAKERSDNYVVQTSPDNLDCAHLHARFTNIGRNHWGYCDECKRKWQFGSNLFSGWKDETEEEWLRNEEMLSTYTLVTN